MSDAYNLAVRNFQQALDAEIMREPTGPRRARLTDLNMFLHRVDHPNAEAEKALAGEVK